MARIKLSRDVIRGLEPGPKMYEVRDSDVTGLMVRVYPTGRMMYVCEYTRGRKVNIGRADVMTPTDARDLARGVIADYARGIDPAEERRKVKMPTFAEYLTNTYGPWLKQHRKSGDATLAMLEKQFVPTFGKMPMDQINAFAVEKWRTQALKSGTSKSTRKNGTSRASVNRYMNAFGAALSRAVDWGIIGTHPLRGRVKPLKVDSVPKTRYLSPDEAKRLRAALAARDERLREQRASFNKWRAARHMKPLLDLTGLHGDHLTPAVIVSLNTGLRRSELLGLSWENVDLDKGMLTVTNTKSGHSRYVPLNTEALEALKLWRKQSTGAYVFPNPDGEPLAVIDSAWRSILTAAEVTGFRWHDMRHDFASNLVMRGVDLNTVRELLGHADMKMTLRYAHLAPHVKVDAVARLMESVDVSEDTAEQTA